MSKQATKALAHSTEIPATSDSVIVMARLTPTSSRSTGHNGDFLPPYLGGGDGNRDGGDSKPDFMPNYGERLRRARLGLAVAMTPILMLFLSFSAVYLVRRGVIGFDVASNMYMRFWAPVQLPWLLLLANTLVLISSSITIDFARREITREAALAPIRSIPGVSLGDERRFPWLAVTTALGVLFLIGQLIVWRDLSGRGFHLAGGTSSSFIYVLTAMHGIHLAGGVVALLFADIASLLDRPPIEGRRIIVDITSWYWHAMTGIWIYILLLFSFAAQ